MPSVRLNHQTRKPIIDAMINTMLPTITNAKKPNTIDAPMANAPTIMTKMFAMGFPAGKPLFADDVFKPFPFPMLVEPGHSFSIDPQVWGLSR